MFSDDSEACLGLVGGNAVRRAERGDDKAESEGVYGSQCVGS